MKKSGVARRSSTKVAAKQPVRKRARTPSNLSQQSEPASTRSGTGSPRTRGTLPSMAMPRIWQPPSDAPVKARRGEVPAIGAEVRQTSLAFKAALHNKLRARNLTSAQWAFLRVLWNGDGLNQKDLAARVGVRSATAVPAISILARNGYVRRERGTNDRRHLYVYLTDEGRQLAFDLIPFATANNRKALRGIAPADVERLMNLLWTIQQNLAE